MKSDAFWNWFDTQAGPQLALREMSFRKIFKYLDTLDGPITIVETGCAREANNWQGDGQSTVLFDHYVTHGHPESVAHTVDLDPRATDVCKSLVSHRVEVHTGDSVSVLLRILNKLKSHGRIIDLLYLDSYDLDWSHPTPSAVHHLKELVSIISAVGPHTLVVVDDAPQLLRAVANDEGRFTLLGKPTIGGKGVYVAEYAEQVGAKLQFSHYQVGWTGLGGG